MTSKAFIEANVLFLDSEEPLARVRSKFLHTVWSLEAGVNLVTGGSQYLPSMHSYDYEGVVSSAADEVMHGLTKHIADGSQLVGKTLVFDDHTPSTRVLLFLWEADYDLLSCSFVNHPAPDLEVTLWLKLITLPTLTRLTVK